MEVPDSPPIAAAAPARPSPPRWPDLSLRPWGLLAGAAFFYVAIKAQQRRCVAVGRLYVAVAAVRMVVPTPSADGALHEGVGPSTNPLVWGLGTVHPYAVRGQHERR